MQQPKTHKEFQSLLQSSIESQPFVYIISSPDRTFLDNKDWKLIRKDIAVYKYMSKPHIGATYTSEQSNTTYRVNIFSSPDDIKRFCTDNLTVNMLPNPGPNERLAALNWKNEHLPHNFFFSKYNNKLIGNFSYERKFGIWEDAPTNEIHFQRGNCFIQIKAQMAFVYDSDIAANGTRKIKFADVPDPREDAWKIDQYLKNAPLTKLGDDEKQKIKTLEITLPKDIEFEQGKEYPLDFPRKSPDGTVPAEIRLVVSRGEIQQIIETNVTEGTTTFPNPALLAPDIDGKYTVLFGQPEKQTINCYHINEEGKCLAWGEIEVVVKKTETSIQQENEKKKEQTND